jgi:hypothetical protein
MTHSPSTIRDVPIEPPSIRAELGSVIRVAMAIVVGVWLYLSSTLTGVTTAQRNLLPFQTTIENRPPLEQRMFRELQEGLLESEARRSTMGAWPDVGSLATDGVPPFAVDPTEKGAKYRWQMTKVGTYVNYLGIPNQPDAPAWLVLISEPEPGAPPDLAKEDEEHHKLLDGTMLHVSTWSHPDGVRLNVGFERLPQAEGWTQLYVVGPAQTNPQLQTPTAVDNQFNPR